MNMVTGSKDGGNRQKPRKCFKDVKDFSCFNSRK